VSLHHWSDPRFGSIIRRWLPDANAAQLEEIEAVNAELPFSRKEVPLEAPA
jgi:predicted N-acyltransferase